MFVNEFIVFNGKYACKLRIKNVVCDILRRSAILAERFLLTGTISTKFPGKQKKQPGYHCQTAFL
jgi:hypothetical protein